MESEYTPIKVGKGNKVHAGVKSGEYKVGKSWYPKYRHLCGSGNSSFAHSFRKASTKKLPSGTKINCQKCLDRMGNKE